MQKDASVAGAEPVIDEAALGMGTYLTADLPGTGGRLKAFAEDFVVEEVPLQMPRPQAEGKYTVAQVRARNWETNRLVREIADRLGVNRRGIFFAGTKDKRAVTTQYLSVRAPLERVQALDIKDVDVLDTFRVDRAPKIGELVGNRFVIRVRGFEGALADAESRAAAVLERLETEGGFPNYFGVQRFGVMRPVTHVVGERITRGDWEGAVMTYVGNPMSTDPVDAFEARERFHATKDAEAALHAYPRKLSFERQILGYLADRGDDWSGAFRALPRNLAQMFVHAWQSWLFNRIVTERLEAGLGLNEPHPGDLVVGLGPNGTPDRTRFMPVSTRNVEKVAQQCARGKGFVTGVLLGTDVPLATGEPGEIEARVLAKAGVTPDDFLIEDEPSLSSSGTRKELLAPLGPVRLDAAEDEHGAFVELRFFLAKGTYATSCMREVLKSPPGAYS